VSLVVLASGTPRAAVALLVILCIATAVGRLMMLREDSKNTKISSPPEDDHANRFDLREPRDLLILVAAIALGGISVVILLGIKLGL
jgi:hypothetical protein